MRHTPSQRNDNLQARTEAFVQWVMQFPEPTAEHGLGPNRATRRSQFFGTRGRGPERTPLEAADGGVVSP